MERLNRTERKLERSLTIIEERLNRLTALRNTVWTVAMCSTAVLAMIPSRYSFRKGMVSALSLMSWGEIYYGEYGKQISSVSRDKIYASDLGTNLNVYRERVEEGNVITTRRIDDLDRQVDLLSLRVRKHIHEE